MIHEFVENSEKSTAYVDGLEYLMMDNDFSRTVRFVE